MKTSWHFFRILRRPELLVLTMTMLVVSCIPHAYGQCPGGDEPDALGCPAVQDPAASLRGSPASISIGGSPQVESPKADTVTDNSGDAGLSGRSRYKAEGPEHRGSEPKPEPLTEFQRFVAASTGQILPIYGADLFSSVPASFGAIDQGPAPGETIIGTDDELRIRVWGQVNFSANLRVSREGEIYIPKVGAVHVAGMPFSAVSAHVRSVMEHVYRNFEMSVDLGEIHSIQIYITGLAHRPGEYTVSALSTLVDATFVSGGPSAAGSMRHVLLKRSGRVITDFDLYALMISGDKTGDMQLQPGDVLYFPVAGPQVALLGSVRQAGIYELRGKESIDELLNIAGGKTTIASGGHLSLERIEDHAQRRAFEVASDATGLATLLTDGDIVRIDPILSSYRETVTLRGGVANPGHFRWHEGMRLSELMPDRDALEKRDYWWHRTQLGLPAPESASPAGIPVPAPVGRPAAVESPSAQTNWNYAVIERLNPATMKTTLIPFSLGKLVLDHDMSQDQELMAGDVITIFTQADIQIPIGEQTIYVTLEGEFRHPGIYSVTPGETLHSVVEHAGGLTKQAYLYAATFTRKSTQVLEQQHLDEFADQLEHQLVRGSMASVSVASGPASQQANSLNRELIGRIRNVRTTGRIVLHTHLDKTGQYELPDIHLEDGDRLVVPFTPETIQVLGAVMNPHAFIFHSGAKAGEYLHLAGGTNREADRKRIFILRADGTTVSSDEAGSSFFAGGFNDLRLYPGDSIVVPEKNLRLSTMAQFLAWTSALSQSSLPAVEATALAR
jgi:polysaccharide export outer membrane protein